MKLTDVMPAGARLRAAVERRFQQWQREVAQRQDAATVRLEADLRRIVAEYIADDSVAEFVSYTMLVALVQDNSVQRMYRPTVVGVKFTAGRKPGSVGKLRMWVRKFVAKHPTATPAQAWAALAKRPPKGVTVTEGFRPHVWVDGVGETGLARFKNIVSEERRALK